jgi:hypothetical protein
MHCLHFFPYVLAGLFQICIDFFQDCSTFLEQQEIESAIIAASSPCKKPRISSENAPMPSRFVSGMNASPVGTYNNGIQVDSKCSIGTRTEAEKATELDQSRLESDSNSKRGAASVDVAEGAGTMDADKRGAASMDVVEGAGTVVPTVNDVLGGKGGKTVDHNLHYTRLCAQMADEYDATTIRG